MDDTVRKLHNRGHARYVSDLIDKELELHASVVPPAKPGGRPNKTDLREV